MSLKTLLVHPSTLHGGIAIPPSKSQTMRAILFALRARGKSTISDPLLSPDTHAMLCAIEQLGAKVQREEKIIHITGTQKLSPVQTAIDAKNSGIVLRFIGAMAGHLPSMTILTGDHSLQTNRPSDALLSALTQLGVKTHALKLPGYAPFVLKGPMTPGSALFSGVDSQPVSAMLIATSFLEGKTELHINHPGEKAWVALTLDWLHKLGANIVHETYARYTIYGPLCYEGFSYQVPGDFSSAAFPIIAALITNSEIVLHNLDVKDQQGDKRILQILHQMGAMIEVDEEKNQLRIHKHRGLHGVHVDINDCIDSLPILAALGCFAQSTMKITGAAIARHKESDRIHAISSELQKMGAKIEEHADGLTIFPSKLHGTSLDSHSDHRIAMTLTVAALGAKNESRIHGVHWMQKSYPTFVRDFQKLGAKIS